MKKRIEINKEERPLSYSVDTHNFDKVARVRFFNTESPYYRERRIKELVDREDLIRWANTPDPEFKPIQVDVGKVNDGGSFIGSLLP